MIRVGVMYVVALVVFGALMGERLKKHSTDNHYVYMADGFINGRLHLEGNPPHRNDWAKYEGKWYVSFPPAPAVLMIPGVAIFGMDFNDTIFTLLFAAMGPALLLLLLELLIASGRLERNRFETALLGLVYGVGTVYFFAAVQGTVWYTAHMVGGVFLLLFAIFSIDAKHPILAGLALGLAFACRPPMLLAFPFFLYMLLSAAKTDESKKLGPWIVESMKSIGVTRLIKTLALFALPVALTIVALMLLNWGRFDDPFEFGHKYLQVRWRDRIDTWGLFNYHYLSRNLAVAFTLLPWLSIDEPHIQISRHGLAIWFTTPVLVYALFPKRVSAFYKFLAITVLFASVPSLLYQNSGWIQFGYRFSLDYTPFLFLMVAASGRGFKKLFIALCAFALVVNLFGAWSFDRHWKYYPGRSTTTYFQPD